ncbi:MAG: Fur family transcriptional regulator [Asgard group archaeon]|nr:Fur family transcriptional regulator [Asgard group archaeon]
MSDTQITNQEELIKILRESNKKITPQRLAICEFILDNKKHFSAEEIFDNIRKRYPSISRATIYKTLSLLKELDIVKELCFSGEPAKYDTNTDLHANIICANCHKIRNYESQLIENFWEDLTKEIGKEPVNHRIDFFIICEDCKEKT